MPPASSLRSRPLSTKTQTARSPIAVFSRAAVTAESTPPLSAQSTRPSPTSRRMLSTASSMKLRMDQPPSQPATPNRKLRKTSMPRGVWTTSGWNCTP